MEKDLKKSMTMIASVPTLERQQHNGGIITQAASSSLYNYRRYRAIVECALDLYALQKQLTPLEHCAGLKFRHAYLCAVLKIRVGDGDVMKDVIPITVACERRLRKAYALLTACEKSVIISVCGHNEWAGTAGRLELLQRGLQKLSELWLPLIRPHEAKQIR